MDSTSLISMFLPDGILDYFEITNVLKSEEGFNIYLSEKNSDQSEKLGGEFKIINFVL